MYKYLFFDDQKLFVREHLQRAYGMPELLSDSLYQDPHIDINLGYPNVFRAADGRYHMIYQGYGALQTSSGLSNIACDLTRIPRRKTHVMAAISDDGIHFTPRNTASQSNAHPDYPNSVSDDSWGLGELGVICADENAAPSERYQALMVRDSASLAGRPPDYLRVSPDLIHWAEKEHSCWHQHGTEPIVGIFRNDFYHCWTILCRREAGERRVGFSDTTDFRHFTQASPALQIDSLDEPLAELYGMPAFSYDGWYVGFPYLYGNHDQRRWWKGEAGTMHCEVAYSLDGHCWQRCLRTPFLSGMTAGFAEALGTAAPILWVAPPIRRPDGSLLIHASFCGYDHGGLHYGRNSSGVITYALRPDGFLKLVAEPGKIARLDTRENIYHGGPVNFNLKSPSATAAVYEVMGNDIHALPGFNHEFCQRFSGDSTAWTPQWQGGALEQFKGHNLVFEIKLYGGELYSICGDLTPVSYVEARKYQQFGELPDPQYRW